MEKLYTIQTDTLTDIADAIRIKKSSTSGILVQNMAQEILSIPTGGGEATLIEKNITENGEYVASDDAADGYSKVVVNVESGAKRLINWDTDCEWTTLFEGSGTGTINFSDSIWNYQFIRIKSGHNSGYAQKRDTILPIEILRRYTEVWGSRINFNQRATNQYICMNIGDTSWTRAGSRNSQIEGVYGCNPNFSYTITKLFDSNDLATPARNVTGTQNFQVDFDWKDHTKPIMWIVMDSGASDRSETQVDSIVPNFDTYETNYEVYNNRYYWIFPYNSSGQFALFADNTWSTNNRVAAIYIMDY